MTKSKLIFLCVAFISIALQSYAQVGYTNGNTLKVGVTGSEPFVFENTERGIAIEIWGKIANQNKWHCEYVFYDNVSTALNELATGRIDVIAGPVSITSSRLENMHFSQPFYNSSISIMSLNQELTLWQKMKPFFSFRLLIAVLIFLIILGLVGALLWLAERKASPQQFPHDALNGIGTGMWLAIVTMTTTGYGDKAPITIAGRIITGVWMIVSLISATSMVAGIASVLTVSSLGKSTISNIEQLSQKKVVTISGSPAEEFLSKSKINTITVDNMNEAITKLKQNEVSALVYDRPQLLYYLKNNTDNELYISNAEYYKQGYGFAFPLSSSLVSDVNRTLLEITENQEKGRIIHFYIQKDD